MLSVALVISVLTVTDTPYSTYFAGAQVVHFLLGPATVALAIPLYGEVQRLKSIMGPVMIASLVGSATAVVSATGIAAAFGASPEIVWSLASKSTTMPVAIGISEKIGALAPLTALTVTLTGISGAIMARRLLGALRVTDPAVQGFAVGLTAHAIGTAYALQLSEAAGAFAALGMGLNGVATTLLVPLAMRIVAGH